MVDCYRIEKKLGSGRFANVFLAHSDESEGKPSEPVAIKRYTSETSNLEAGEELVHASTVWHHHSTGPPNLLRFIRPVLDPATSVAGSVPYGAQEPPVYALVFEYCNLGTLEELIASRLKLAPAVFFTPLEIMNVARQLCAGLAALHDLCIVHRDVAPRNILVHRVPTGYLVFKLGRGTALFLVSTKRGR